MKYIIASDIHGSYDWCEKLLQAFEKEKADKLILLGDLLYHGARNDLPQGYDTKKVFAALNTYKDKIVAIRGNCDSEVDQMVLDFPCLADYALLEEPDRTLFLTHGHLFNKQNPPLLKERDILFNGHFHTPCHEKLANGGTYANCGSVSLPKAGTPHSYIVYENGKLTWIDLTTGKPFVPDNTLF